MKADGFNFELHISDYNILPMFVILVLVELRIFSLLVFATAEDQDVLVLAEHLRHNFLIFVFVYRFAGENIHQNFFCLHIVMHCDVTFGNNRYAG